MTRPKLFAKHSTLICAACIAHNLLRANEAPIITQEFRRVIFIARITRETVATRGEPRNPPQLHRVFALIHRYIAAPPGLRRIKQEVSAFRSDNMSKR
jgi:hypothetical protein